jgi:two-component system sensor histidine kinase RegB
MTFSPAKDPGATIRNVLEQNLYRLLLIRSIVFCLQLFALGYAWAIVSMPLNYPLILGIFLVLGITNGILFLRLQKQRQPNAREFLLNLSIDILGLTVLLFFTGGASNPFVSYFLVPVTIGAAALKRSYAVMLTVSALTCYTLLLFFYLPLPALTPMTDGMTMDHNTPVLSLHVLGMWFNFLVSAALISWFVLKMAAENRAQETRLRKYREDTLRNEQIMSVATLAAGTAHELGTPLSSVTMLLKEMQQDHAGNESLQADIRMLQEQIRSCRDSLRSLTRKADYTNIQTTHMSLVLFIREVMDKWQLLRPECRCPMSIMEGAAPQIMVDPTLQQALINMLNNAAESSSRGVKLDLAWDDHAWTLKIRDYGKGISQNLAEQLGTRIVSSREDGMGVGVVLSQATLNRFGGSVSLYPLEEGGTLTEITVPLRLEREPDNA